MVAKRLEEVCSSGRKRDGSVLDNTLCWQVKNMVIVGVHVSIQRGCSGFVKAAGMIGCGKGWNAISRGTSGLNWDKKQSVSVNACTKKPLLGWMRFDAFKMVGGGGLEPSTYWV